MGDDSPAPCSGWPCGGRAGVGVTADTSAGNKHMQGAPGGDPAASPAVTWRYPGHISSANLYGNDRKQLGTELSLIFIRGQGEHLFLRRLCARMGLLLFLREGF